MLSHMLAIRKKYFYYSIKKCIKVLSFVLLTSKFAKSCKQFSDDILSLMTIMIQFKTNNCTQLYTIILFILCLKTKSSLQSLKLYSITPHKKRKDIIKLYTSTEMYIYYTHFFYRKSTKVTSTFTIM